MMSRLGISGLSIAKRPVFGAWHLAAHGNPVVPLGARQPSPTRGTSGEPQQEHQRQLLKTSGRGKKPSTQPPGPEPRRKYASTIDTTRKLAVLIWQPVQYWRKWKQWTGVTVSGPLTPPPTYSQQAVLLAKTPMASPNCWCHTSTCVDPTL
ncbi:uncharacterized protein LOC144158372 [Haemaphysalis longicornis]